MNVLDDTDRLLGEFAFLGVPARRSGVQLELPDGLTLRPWRIHVADDPQGGVTVMLGVAIQHPRRFPTRVADVTAGHGPTADEAALNAARIWATTDLLVILDVIGYAATCPLIERAAGEGTRRVVLGRVDGVAPTAGVPPTHEHAPDCRCCAFNHALPELEAIMEPGPTRMLRFEVSRIEHGRYDAICRVDGKAVPAVAPLLEAWARSWPGTGFAMRRQLVVVHDG